MNVLRPCSFFTLFILAYSLPSYALISLFDSERSEEKHIQDALSQNVDTINSSQTLTQSIPLPIERLTGINFFSNRYHIVILADDNKSYSGTFSKHKGGELNINEQIFTIVEIKDKTVTLKSDTVLQCSSSDYLDCIDANTFSLSMLPISDNKEENTAVIDKTENANHKAVNTEKKTVQNPEMLDAVARQNIANFKRDREALSALQRKAQSKVIRDPELVKNPPPGYVLHKSPFGDYLLPAK